MKRGKTTMLALGVASLSLLLPTACDRRKEKETTTSKPAAMQPAPSKPSMLALVPEDTVIFLGGTEPWPKELRQWNAAHFSMPKNLKIVNKSEPKDGERMAEKILVDYSAAMFSPEAWAAWGLDESPMLVTYAIGLSPVFRISLSDVQQFNRKIDEIEAQAKVGAKSETLGQATFRRYPWNEKGLLTNLIVGVDGSDAVFMLDMGIDSQKTIEMALGQSKPEKSLAQSGRLEALQKKYKLLPFFVGYVDHQQLIAGLVTKDGNRMAQMVQAFVPEASKDAKDKIAELNSEGCRNEFQAIGSNWPQTVFGYSAMDLKSVPSRIDSVMTLEVNDKPFMEGLRSLRGFVPEYASNGTAAFSFAIGLNMENVGPFLMKQWTEATQKQYNCSILQNMQASLKQQNPAAIGMSTGMATGLRGVAFALMSMTVDKAGPEPTLKNVEAIASLSAKDPAALLQTFSAMLPQLAALQIPADGTQVNIPVPMPLASPPKAAVNGSHLTVHAGEQAELTAKSLAKVPLDSSLGIMAMSIDYGMYYEMADDVLSVASAASQAEEAKQAMSVMKDMKNLRLQTRLDFADRGIELQASMVSTKPAVP